MEKKNINKNPFQQDREKVKSKNNRKENTIRNPERTAKTEKQVNCKKKEEHRTNGKSQRTINERTHRITEILASYRKYQ